MANEATCIGNVINMAKESFVHWVIVFTRNVRCWIWKRSQVLYYYMFCTDHKCSIWGLVGASVYVALGHARTHARAHTHTHTHTHTCAHTDLRVYITFLTDFRSFEKKNIHTFYRSSQSSWTARVPQNKFCRKIFR